MYQPRIKEEAIRSIYRLKKVTGKPMTRILDEIIAKGFPLGEREKVCSICKEEGNSDCKNCYLKTEDKAG